MLCVSAGNRFKLLGEQYHADWTGTRYKKTHVTVQDNIETTHLAIGTPISACTVLLSDGNIFLNQLSNKWLTFCIKKTTSLASCLGAIRNNVSSACDMTLKINFVTTVSCFKPYCCHISATIHIIHKSSCQSLTSDVLQTSELLVSYHGSSLV